MRRESSWVPLSILAAALTLTGWYLEQWLLIALPMAIVIALQTAIDLRLLWLSIVLLTPLSIELEELVEGGLSLSVPVELMLAIFTLVLLLMILHRSVISSQIWRHPVTIALGCYLGWLVVTSVFSSSLWISTKFTLAKIWFIVPMYLGGVFLVLKDQRLGSWFLMVCIIPLVAVVLYTTWRHYSYGWGGRAAQWAMQPFYRDHTQYGAVMAFFISACWGLASQWNLSLIRRTIWIVTSLVFTVSLVLTTSRAALLSTAVVLAMLMVVWSRIRPTYILATTGLFLLIAFLARHQIEEILTANQVASSEDLVENVQSIGNVSTDISNLERINRWKAAIAMGQARPIMGFGPGTYSFEYAPYQIAGDLTTISTNFGDVGNAHSEYLGPLAESGVIGMLTFALVVCLVFWCGIRSYRAMPAGNLRTVLLACLLALLSYFVHGFLNNYLESEKAAVPVFGAMGIVVAIDLLRRQDQS